MLTLTALFLKQIFCAACWWYLSHRVTCICGALRNNSLIRTGKHLCWSSLSLYKAKNHSLFDLYILRTLLNLLLAGRWLGKLLRITVILPATSSLDDPFTHCPCVTLFGREPLIHFATLLSKPTLWLEVGLHLYCLLLMTWEYINTKL